MSHLPLLKMRRSFACLGLTIAAHPVFWLWGGAGVAAHPSGVVSHCNTNGFTLPEGMGHVVQQSHLDIVFCQDGNCVVNSASPFRGILISSTAAIQPSSAALKQGLSSHCLTHVDRGQKNTVNFQLAPSSQMATIWVVLVVQRQNYLHQVHLALPYTTNVNFTTYVIGGGPGGIAAARLLESYNAKVHLFERGPDLPAGFYTQPINSTYLGAIDSARKCTPLHPVPQTGASPEIACQYSGNQGANGAIFAPGLPEDFARSVGVSTASATLAQSIAATYVDVDQHNVAALHGQTGYMWKCTNESNCDRSYTASSNTDVNRRSVAYSNGPWLPQNVSFNTEVQYVGGDGSASGFIRFRNGSTLTLNHGDKIILAAGALSTPQLLNMTTWTGWNHYYALTMLGAPVENQSIAYDPATRVETNIANIINPQTLTPMAIKIEMLMEHDIVETFTVNQSYTPSHGGKFLNDAWHYAGTVRTDRMAAIVGAALARGSHEARVPFIFIGDASALATPFNCHTSMPAAAAGVLAVQRALNVLQDDPPAKGKVDGLTKVGVWFASGIAVLAIAVLAHILAGRAGSKTVNSYLFDLHYALAGIAVVIITLGVVVAAYQRKVNVQQSHRGHFYVGYVTLAWLWLQALFGAYLNSLNKTADGKEAVGKDADGKKARGKEIKRKLGWTHRVSALLLFALILYLVFTVALRQDPFENMLDSDDWVAGAAALAAVYILLSVWVAVRLPERLRGAFQKSASTTSAYVMLTAFNDGDW